MHERKMEKSDITAFARMKDKTDEQITMAITFSAPVMKSLLVSTALQMKMKNYFVAESYITIEFDLKETKKEDICPICIEFLKKLDVKVAKAQTLEKSLMKSISG